MRREKKLASLVGKLLATKQGMMIARDLKNTATVRRAELFLLVM
jgi:hypothetical protein